MQTVNIADLKNNLSAWLEQVRNGEELLVKDRNTPIARLIPLAQGENSDVEEAALVAAGLLRLPLEAKNDAFLSRPAPSVAAAALRAALDAERDDE